MKRIAFALSLLLFLVTSAHAQYAYRIRPYPAAPAVCQPGNGDVFFLTTGSLGLYQCTAANTWTAVGVTGAGGIITLPAAGNLNFSTRSALYSPANGSFVMTNAAGADFTRLILGGASVAFPAIGVSAAVGGQTQGIIITKGDGTTATLATLGAATNGSMIYCSDCSVANPCAAGTGAIAKRLNGAWVCN